MKYDELNLQKIREVPIFDVCSKLGISLYGMGKLTKRAKCWYHDDKHPSMHVNKKKNIYKCFVCGKGGDVIKLVQDYENKSFIEACEWLVNEFHVVLTTNTNQSYPTNNNCPADYNATLRSSVEERKEIKEMSPSENAMRSQNSAISAISAGPKTTLVPLEPSLMQKSLSLDSSFCKSVVAAGYLTQNQLVSAASRYRLGCTKDGGVIFWQIDEQQRVHTGKIMYYQPDCHRDKQHNPTWVHSLMKSQLPQKYEFHPCLFGQHLLTSDLGHQPSAVCIVESEKTAVIMSEIVKDFIWLSCGGLQMFKPEQLAPLVNHKVVAFPDTDETGEAFKAWTQVALEAHRLYKFRYPLRVSRLLEDHATLEQKARKIDIVDYLFEVPQK